MPRQRQILALAFALALAAAGLSWLSVTNGPPPGPTEWAAFPVLVLLVALAERLLVRYRYGDEVDGLNCTEAVLAPLVFAFPSPAVVGAVVVGQLLATLLGRNSWVKGVFNAAQWGLAAAMASALVTAWADGAGGISWWDRGVVLVALVAAVVVNAASFTLVLAVARRRALREVVTELAPVIVGGWLVGGLINAMFGLLYVLAYEATPGSVLLFGVPMLALHLGYRAFAAASADRSRLMRLHRAAITLSEPLDPHEALGPYLREVAACFEAEVAALVLRDGPSLTVHRIEGGWDGRYSRASLDAEMPTLEAALVAQPAALQVRAGSRDALAGLLAATGHRDCLSAPLLDEGRLTGVLIVLDQVGIESDPSGRLAVLDALARETVSTFAKGRLLQTVLEERTESLRLARAADEQRNVVEQLQQAVMPACPKVPGAELAVSYVASDDNAPTGGDLYDWQMLQSGEVHAAVVDVLGHGVDATKDALAVVHALRLLASDGTPLERMVARADELISAQHPDLVATCVVARFNPTTGVVRVVSGGHPPAMVVGANGEVTQLVAVGGAIGWPAAGSENVAEATLAPGDSLLLYTDGIVEARKDILEGLETLLHNASDVASLAPQEMVDELLRRALSDAVRSDDSLAMVLRRAPVAATTAIRRWRLAPTVAEVGRGRRELSAWLREQVVPVDEAALVASELLANAVRAAATEVTMTAQLAGARVVVEVGDDGPGAPELGRADGPGSAMPSPAVERGRGLAIVRSLVEDLTVMSTSEGTLVRAALIVGAEPAPAPGTTAGTATDPALSLPSQEAVGSAGSTEHVEPLP